MVATGKLSETLNKYDTLPFTKQPEYIEPTDMMFDSFYSLLFSSQFEFYSQFLIHYFLLEVFTEKKIIWAKGLSL